MIYLDSNAGAPLRQSVVEALSPFFSKGAIGVTGPSLPNASSIHAHGRIAKRLLAEARENVARSLGKSIDPEQIVFTSSGTEANQLAIRSVLENRLKSTAQAHWITTPVEHDSNRQMEAWFKERGGSVSYLPVDENGNPQIQAWPDLVRPDTVLTSLVWVNNETGVISDVRALSRLTQERAIPLHIDAAQAWESFQSSWNLWEHSSSRFQAIKLAVLPEPECSGWRVELLLMEPYSGNKKKVDVEELKIS